MTRGYGAAKAALVSLVRSCSVELGPAVRVNCIAPAHTLTPRLASWLDDNERSQITGRLPVGRLGLPRRVSQVERGTGFVGRVNRDFSHFLHRHFGHFRAFLMAKTYIKCER
jgi:NAD(P)-dependent dehydrogenase (short-subunit alcohol dehydrogenase family)